jgi:hypothetical protein
MPAYSSSPFSQTPALLLPGQAGYSWGSFNDHVPTCKIFAFTSAVNGSNVATVTGKIWEGNVPTVASGFSVISTQGLARIANVTNAAVSSISYNATTGVVTIVYPCTNTTVVSGADSGFILLPQQELPELLSGIGTAPVAGSAFAIGSFAGLNSNGRTIAWATEFPSQPASVTMYLEAAIENLDAQYLILDTSTNPAGDLRYVDVTKFNFVRIKVSAFSGGTAPSVIAKILV